MTAGIGAGTVHSMTSNTEEQDVSDLVWQLFQRQEFRRARAVLMGLLEKDPKDHWSLMLVGNTYHEERNYAKALEYERKALEIAGDCPGVLFNYASALDMSGHKQEAIAVWNKVVHRGVHSIAHGECGEGVRQARTMMNDCRYRIGMSYADLGKNDLAIRYLRSHIAHRGPNCPSTYNLRRVKQELQEIEARRTAGSSGKE